MFANDNDVKEYLRQHPEMFFTAPSIWSAEGMNKYGVPKAKNRVITHGVDRSIFYLHDQTDSKRQAIRQRYNVSDNDILLMNIGAMTGNKGIRLILQALNELVNKRGQKCWKLLLKGSGDLYTSKGFLEQDIGLLIQSKAITESEKEILDKHIIFTDKTISYKRINDLYNAADMYICPYLAEGFNLTSLEALSAGLPVMVPETGSTKEYMFDLYTHGGKDFITYIPSKVGIHPDGRHQNMLELNDIVRLLDENQAHLQAMKVQRYRLHDTLANYIQQEYSWKQVAKLLYDYFCDICEL